ncbi:MAG: hypothetical protein ACI9CE_003558 [Flavobacterium sp.]|jgi:hypothetical protein
MNFTKQLFFIPVFSVMCGAHAATPLLGPDLNSQTIYSGAAITSGAGSMVGGNIQAIEATTIGAGSEVGINLVAGAAITLGASAKVAGDVTAGIVLTLGDSAMVAGNVQSLTGSITLGANAVAFGTVTAGTSITISASAIAGGATTPGQISYDFTHNQRTQLQQAQVALNNMPISTELATTMSVDTTRQPGVYHAAGLTTTAGIILTLDGNPLGGDLEPSFWVFNIDSYMAFGANTTIKLLNVHQDSTIIWNTGSYTTIGPGSNIIGAIIADSYVTTGAGTTLTGVDNACPMRGALS